VRMQACARSAGGTLGQMASSGRQAGIEAQDGYRVARL
jgi:hypothetical protein